MQSQDAISAITDLGRRDGNVPGFGLMLDPVRLFAVLRDQLDCSRVDNIHISYVRYKAGMNCLARYDMEVDGQPLLAYAKAHGRDAKSKLVKAMDRKVTDSVLGPGRVVLAQQQIVFSVFPNDAKLPSLERLGSSGCRQRLWRRILGQHSPWQNSTLAGVMNYKPEHRYVARLERPDGAAALLKFYTRSGFEQARAVGRQSAGSQAYWWPELIGKSKKHAVLAFRWQPGHSLRELQQSGSLTSDDLVATGQLLARLHSSGLSGLPVRDFNAQVEAVQALGSHTGYLLPHLRPRAGQVAGKLATWLAEQDPALKPVHGDFYDKQVIIRNHHARMIDFDSARLDDPLTDIGNYFAHLEKRAIHREMTAAEAGSQQQTLLGAYQDSAGAIDTQALDRYTALNLLALVQNPFRDQLSNWPRQTERILQRVETLFQR